MYHRTLYWSSNYICAQPSSNHVYELSKSWYSATCVCIVEFWRFVFISSSWIKHIHAWCAWLYIRVHINLQREYHYFIIFLPWLFFTTALPAAGHQTPPVVQEGPEVYMFTSITPLSTKKGLQGVIYKGSLPIKLKINMQIWSRLLFSCNLTVASHHETSAIFLGNIQIGCLKVRFLLFNTRSPTASLPDKRLRILQDNIMTTFLPPMIDRCFNSLHTQVLIPTQFSFI